MCSACGKIENDGHTAGYLLSVVQKILREFNLIVSAQLVFVTDNGSNMMGNQGLPSQYTRLACLDHRLSTVITTVLNKTTTTVNGNRNTAYAYETRIPAVFALVDACKNLVRHFKQARLQDRLTTTLKQENSTRWGSLLRCLKSVHKSFDDVTSICQSRRRSGLTECIDTELLAEVIKLLEPFQQATLALETFESPTLHKALYWYTKLRGHLKANIDDSDVVATLRSILAEVFEEKVHLDLWHYVGAYMDPASKAARRGRNSFNAKMPPSMYDDAEAKIKRMMVDAFERGTAAQVQVLSADMPRPPAKRKRNEMYSDASSDDEKTAPMDPIELELLRYKAIRISTATEDFDVFAWWKARNDLPLLKEVARSVFAIPTSSAKSESNFSDGGNTVTKQRNRLSPSMVDDLLFFRSLTK